MNAPVELQVLEGLFQQQYRQIETRFEAEHGLAWTRMVPAGAPCFNPGMLEELRRHDRAIEATGGRVIHNGELHQIRYYVVASGIDDIFNLGGDLSLFLSLIQARDGDALMRYALLCVDNMYPRICNYGSPMTTISLVQGEALGGGFETALSSSVIIAERRSRMGMPEILFNLFPGMGAYSLLARRVGMKRAEEMILSGKLYSATELHAMGIVDVLAENGAGESAVYDYIARSERRRNGIQAVYSCRQHYQPVSYDEMRNIVTVWVDAALRLEEKDLRLMSRLVRSQLKRVNGAPAPVPALEELRVAMA